MAKTRRISSKKAGGCGVRTTLDLIGELEREGGNFDLVALAVGFADLTEFVLNSDQQKVEKLAYLLGEGGQPVGLIGTETRGDTIRIRCRVLDEYKDDPWAAEYLESLTDLFLLVAQNSGEAYAKIPVGLHRASPHQIRTREPGV